MAEYLRIPPGESLRGTLLRWSCVATTFAVLTLVQPAVTSARVQLLVAAGVSSVVRGTPVFGDPTILWTTTPTCAGSPAGSLQQDTQGGAAVGVPGDEFSPALISRESVHVDVPRAIFSFNPPRPVGTCNPYQLLSDVVSDGTFIYYVDNQGSGSRAALWRRDRLANPEDASQPLADLGADLAGAELIVVGNYVFAIHHKPNTFGGFDILVQYDKTTGAVVNQSVEHADPDALTNLQFDGRYLYWLNLGALRRDDFTSGATVTVVNAPISAYYLEGYDQQCSPLGCDQFSRVLYAQGSSLFEVETISNTVFPLYTSPVAGAEITAITRDAVNLFFIERRPVSGGFEHDHRIFRLPVGDSTPALLYGPVNNGGLGFDSFTTDLEWLYFHDRAAHTLLRTENNASAIAVHSLQATGLEVSQGLQNRANQLRLIAGKRTIVRFYVKSAIALENVDGVTAALSGSNEQGFLGTLAPVNDGGKQIKVRFFPLRQNLADSFQFELPRSWTTGGTLTLSAKVNPAGRVVEDTTDDNSSDLGPIEFTPSPRLHVGYVNFWYPIDGVLYRPADADVVSSQQRMRRLYPLSEPDTSFAGPGLHFTTGDVVDFGLAPEVMRTAKDCTDRYEKAGDRNMCASDYVHAQLDTMRRAGFIRPETVSYGNIAPAPAPEGLSYFTRGYTHGRVSSGPSDDANYASHEVGHVLGRAHPVPGSNQCGHSASDPAYPYAASWIEDITLDYQTRYAGLDFADADSGELTYLDAVSNYDTMSYCAPNWISDYTFNGLYAFLTAPGQAAGALAAQQAPLAAVAGDWLMATGTLDPALRRGGFVVVQRTDSVADATPPVAGGFTLELRNAGGRSAGELSIHRQPARRSARPRRLRPRRALRCRHGGAACDRGLDRARARDPRGESPTHRWSRTYCFPVHRIPSMAWCLDRRSRRGPRWVLKR